MFGSPKDLAVLESKFEIYENLSKEMLDIGLSEEAKQLTGWICDILDNMGDESVIERVKGQVSEICARFPVYA